MQIGTDEPAASYLGSSGSFELVLYHDNAGDLDPDVTLGHNEEAVVIFDNAEVLEYDSEWLAGPHTVACLPTWPENTAEESVLVSAESPTSSEWTLVPEPSYKRFGEWSTAVRTTAKQQFFKLTPGTQFSDDFNPPKPPYASKSDWVPWFYNDADATRWSVACSNGVLRVRTLLPSVDQGAGRLTIAPPGPFVTVKDFWASVDILNLTVAHENGLAGIVARGVWDPASGWPGDSNGYIGSVVPNDDGVNQARLNFFPGAWPPNQGKGFTFKPGTPYRLIFSGIGQRFSVELVDLTTGQPAIDPLVVTNPATTFSQGFAGLFIQAGTATNVDATLDNFFLTGTKPESP